MISGGPLLHTRTLVWHEGAVHYFNDMKDVLVRSVDGSSGAELQDTARVGRSQDLGSGGLGVAHFQGE